MAELERVPGAQDVTPTVDVVLVHGLGGDPKTTWMSRSSAFFWPRALAEEVPAAAVWTLGYEAHPTKLRWPGGKRRSDMGLVDRGRNVLAELGAEGIGRRPTCFICHSLGGLLVKRFIVGSSKLSDIADNTRCVVFLATPHTGAAIADTAAKLGRRMLPTAVLRDLGATNRWLDDDNDKYRTWADADGAIEQWVFYETQPVPGIGVVVSAREADPGLPRAQLVPVDADHIQISKPLNTNALVYKSIRQIVDKLSTERPNVPQHLSLPPRVPVAEPPRQAAHQPSYLTVYRGTGWIDTLTQLYPRFPMLRFGEETFPIHVRIAAESSWTRPESVLGRLSTREDVSRYPDSFDERGLDVYRSMVHTADPKSNFDAPTYALDQIELNGDAFTLHAKHGSYFLSRATSECLATELESALAHEPNEPVGLERLPRRRFLHDVANGEHVVLDGHRRSAAISVAATTLIAERDGTFSAVLARRSRHVATDPGRYHVAPSGIFQPINASKRDSADEYSVTRCILREYAEELFCYRDLERGDGIFGENPDDLPPVSALLEAARQRDRVELLYCGIGIPLTTLRPEIYVLILIKDPLWLEEEILRANTTDHYFRLNWEYGETAEGSQYGTLPSAHKLRLNPDLSPVQTRLMNPVDMVPHAAAALQLSTSVARRVLRI